MTRSITIVNTSNQDGEDYEITGATVGGFYSDGEATTRRLRPGERLVLSVPEKSIENIEITPVTDEPTKPFYVEEIDDFGKRETKQVVPRVQVEFTR